MIVDWEYAGMGDRFFDLGNFAVNNELDDDGEARLLEAYFGEPATARRRAALQLFRFMSDFREAMWGVVQSAVSELDFDFDGLRATSTSSGCAATAADPRFRGWLEEAGVAPRPRAAGRRSLRDRRRRRGWHLDRLPPG